MSAKMRVKRRGTISVPPRNAKRWQGFADQRTRLMEQAGVIGQMLEGEVRAWAEGVGVRIGEGGQPPHYHLADNCTQLREGKPPEPQVIDMKDVLAAQAARAKVDKKKKA